MTEENVNKPKRFETTVLDYFKNIVADNEKQRTKSQVALCKYLAVDEEAKINCNYTLDRLIRGLGSSKYTSKTGYYTALVSFINAIEIPLNTVFESMKKELHSSASNSKSENADIFCGQILACGAIIRSGLFKSANAEEQTKLIRIIFDAGLKRNYLTLASYTFLMDIYDIITEDEFTSILLPIIKEKIGESKSLDSIYLIICTKNKFPDVDISHTFEINKAVIKEVCTILLSPPRISFIRHPVYKLIAETFAENHLDLIPTFTAELDLSICNSKNFNKLSFTIVVLTHILNANVDAKHVIHLLQNNVLQQLIMHCKQINGQQKDSLKILIIEFLESISNVLCKEGVKQKHKVAVLKRLWETCMDFERITKSRVVQRIIASLSVDGVQKLEKVLKQIIHGTLENTIGYLSNNHRVYAAQLLVKLLSHPIMNDQISWKLEQLKFISDLAFFENDGISVELSDSLRNIFFLALDIKFQKLDDRRLLLSMLVNHVDTHFTGKDNEHVTRVPLSILEVNLWRETIRDIDDISNKIDSQTVSKKNETTQKHLPNVHLMRVFHTLYLHMALHLLQPDVNTLGENVLSELRSCYKRVLSETSNQSDNGDEEEELPWIQVVVDLFLNLLSHNSHLLRSMIGCVFPHLCGYLTRDAVHQILAVLEPSFDVETLLGDSDDSEDSEEDDEIDNDKSNLEENTDSDEQMEMDEEDAQETVNERLRDALSTVLRNQHKAESDEESVDVDDMDETEAKKLNDALSSAFKQFRQNSGKKSKKQSKDEQTLTHFRVRVLDLIDIYIDMNPNMLLALEIMLPLLQALEFSIKDEHQKPLLHRICHCLRKLTSLKRFDNSTMKSVAGDDSIVVTQTALYDLLRGILVKGARSALITQDMSTQISSCCIFILRCSSTLAVGDDKADEDQVNTDKITALMVDALKSFCSNRDCLIPYALFKKILATCWLGNLQLAENLPDIIFDETVRPFHRTQALELLTIFYSNQRLLNSFQDNTDHLKTMVKIEYQLYLGTKSALSIENIDKDVKLKDRFVTNLFSIWLVVLRNQIKGKRDNLVALAEVLRKYRTTGKLSKGGKSAYKRLCIVLGVSDNVEMMCTSTKIVTAPSSVITNGHVKTKCKAKNKKGKLAAQLERKETKRLRMEAMSKGLDSNYSFETNLHYNGSMDAINVEYERKSTSNHINLPKKRRNSTMELSEIIDDTEKGNSTTIKRKKGKTSPV